MAEHNQTGNIGEQLACQFLKNKGYEVLETNWRFKNLEIDIIANHKNTLIIIEVKTRKGSIVAPPEEFVDKTKQKNLLKATSHYMEGKELDLEVRFDIISIIFQKNGDTEKHVINHIEDAFGANW